MEIKFIRFSEAPIPINTFTWFVGRLFGSPDSFPQEHLTVWPFTSVLCTATMACAADSFVENLEEKSTMVLKT